MISIDHQLLHQARRLITGANVHLIGTYILLYEQAVKLHNAGVAKYVHYHAHYEKLLREIVRATLRAKTLSERIRLGTSRAQNLWEQTRELQPDIDRKIAAKNKSPKKLKNVA